MNRAEKRRQAKQAQAAQPTLSSGRPARRKKRNGVYRTNGDPQQLMAMLEQGHKLYIDKQPEQAKLVYHAILQIDPNFPDANNSLGIIDVEAGNHGLAERWFEKAINAEPTRPTFHNNRGLALMEIGRTQESVRCFEASLDADPDFVPAMVNLGKGFNASRNFAGAVPLLEKVITTTPDFLDAYTELANAQGELGDLNGALKTLDAALAIRPDSSKLLNQKAGLFITFGKLDDAEAIFRKIAKTNPDNAGAYVAISRTKKFESYDDDMANMERLYKKMPDVDFAKTLKGEAQKDGEEDPKMNLAMALAKAHEAIKNYEQSFFYYKEGNRLRRKKYSYDQAGEFLEFDLRRELFTPALLQQFNNVGDPDNTPIFIVGMPRSGTTLLEQVFHSHRDVFGAGELGYMPQLVRSKFKDMRVFEDKLKAGKVTAETFREMGAAYIEKIRELNSESPYITDKMPHNFMQVGFIKLALPNAKVIHSYRNPIDNAFAIFKQIFGNDAHQYAYDLVELGHYHNKYRELMAHWDSIFPGQILENRYEDMVADLETQTRKVLDFCGLDWDPNCLNFHESDRAIRTASVTQVRQPIYTGSVEKWRKYEAQLQPLIRVLEKGLPF
jgi:tetratricopeptide (TPR) repeat protein